nr:unnamed protein product [Spirometra erinaceieuropaei]
MINELPSPDRNRQGNGLVAQCCRRWCSGVSVKNLKMSVVKPNISRCQSLLIQAYPKTPEAFVLPRQPRLGVSAVMHNHQMAISAEIPRPAVPTPLTLGGETTVPTCRFRPGLRPIRIIDMSQFRLRRKPNHDHTTPSSSPKSFRKPLICSATLPKQTATTASSRRQPLKAFPQDTVRAQMSLRDLSLQPSTEAAYAISSKSSQLPSTEKKSTRITTNPVYRRHSSASLTQSSSGDDDILKPDEDTVPGNNRKRRSALFSLSKKRRESVSSLTETKSSGGVITRLRSSALLTYEVVKRAVRRRSQTALSSCSGGRLPNQRTGVQPAAVTDDERLSF